MTPDDERYEVFAILSSHATMTIMRESQKVDQPVSNDAWGASDVLVLEGLNGLAKQLASPFKIESGPASSDRTEMAGESAEADFHENDDFFAEASAPQRMEGFRSARELRAAQERFAAQRRSAWRRRARITQALGIKSTVTVRGTTPANFMATDAPTAPGQAQSQPPLVDQRDQWPISENITPRPPINRMASSEPRSESSPQTEAKAVESASFQETAPPSPGRTPSPSPWRPVPSGTSAPPASAPPQGPPRQDGTAPTSEPTHFPEKKAPEKQMLQAAPRVLRSTAPHVPASSEQTKAAAPRNVTPQMETAVRRRRTTSSFLPSILTSLLLTSLLWGGLLYGFWHYGGDALLGERIQEETTPLMADQTDDLRVAQARLSIDVRALEEQAVLIQARHEQFVRMNALEAAVYAENSRAKFDDLLELGRKLATGSSEEEFFQQTKNRIEAAYSARLSQHSGLDVRKYFPQLGVTQETNLDKAALINFLIKADKTTGWDRARGAILLRKFKDDDTVIASLIEIMRDDQDLQVVLAAWESLLDLTDYVPGSKGFSPWDFNRWWSTR